MHWALVLLLLTSCSAAHLKVRSERITTDYLASSEIETPNLCCPCLCGEQLVIRYKGLCSPGHLTLHVRFSNHEVETYVRKVSSPSGYWVYRNVNESLQCKGQILGYKVELFEGCCCKSIFTHLWADPIEVTE